MLVQWTAFTADEQPAHEEASRSWLAIVGPSDDCAGIIYVYGPSKETTDVRARVIARTLNVAEAHQPPGGRQEKNRE